MSKSLMSRVERSPAESGFWRRYSPHHELPLSTATSMVLHMLILLAVAMAGSFVFSYEPARGPTIGVVWRDGGGGGQADGISPDLEAKPAPGEEAPAEAAPLMPALKFDPSLALLPRPGATPRGLANAQAAAKTAQGKGGEGSGGGKGDGKGTGTGDGRGPGNQDPRMARWNLQFVFMTGEDYALQMALLKAYIAMPVHNDDDRVTLYKDLTQRPVQGEEMNREDLGKLNRLYFLNNDKRAAGLLCQGLGITRPPEKFWALFSEELEKELSKKEQVALKNHKKKEEDIKQTLFRVLPQGKGVRIVLTKIEFK